MSTKPSTRQVYDSVDDAVSCVARFNADKTLTQIAAEMGWTVEQLSCATDPNKKPRFAANWIEPLTKTTGDDAIVRTLCARVGGVFVRLHPSGVSHDAMTAKTLKEIGEYFTKLAEGAVNGYTRAEVEGIEIEGHDVIASVFAHIAKLKAEAK